MLRIFSTMTLGLMMTIIAWGQSITSVDPDSAYQGQILSVTVSGQSTTFGQGSSTGMWLSNGSETCIATGESIQSMTEITGTFAISPFAAVGTWDVHVFDDVSVVSYDAFTVLPSSNGSAITSVVPDEGMQGQQVTVTLECTGTAFSQSDEPEVFLSMGFSEWPASDVSVQNATTLEVTFDLEIWTYTGEWDVNIIDDNQWYGLEDGFVVTEAPQGTVTADPNMGSKGQSLGVTISGQSTFFGQGSGTTVMFHQPATSTYIYGTGTSVQNITTLETNLSIPSNAPTGYYDIHVYDSEHYVGLNGFLVIPDELQVIEVDPDMGEQGAVVTVAITGTLTDFGVSANTAAWLSRAGELNLYATVVVVHSSDSISATFAIPATAELGLWNINVQDALPYFKEDAFTIVEPTGLNNPPVEEVRPVAYPNPCGPGFWVGTDHLPGPGDVELSVSDHSGRVLYVIYDRAETPSYQKWIDLDELSCAPGLYFVQLRSGTAVFTTKVMKQEQ